MQPRVTVHDAAVRLEGPLLFMHRTLDVGLNEAVTVSGPDGAPRSSTRSAARAAR